MGKLTSSIVLWHTHSLSQIQHSLAGVSGIHPASPCIYHIHQPTHTISNTCMPKTHRPGPMAIVSGAQCSENNTNNSSFVPALVLFLTKVKHSYWIPMFSTQHTRLPSLFGTAQTDPKHCLLTMKWGFGCNPYSIRETQEHLTPQCSPTAIISNLKCIATWRNISRILNRSFTVQEPSHSAACVLVRQILKH